jgi:dipeptidyl aminopeptidase/acylaminoacyl peptidase
MKRILAILFIAGCVALAAFADQGSGKRAFEIADFYGSAFPASPVVSPDGKHVVFTVRRFTFDKNKAWSELWVMSPDGSNMRRLTSDHNDASPTFARDSKKIIFVSDRDKRQELYVVSVNGGSPKRLTNIPMGVSNPLMSPDGNYIAVTSNVYPECGANEDCNRKIAAGLQGTLRVHVAESLLYRHWNSWSDGAYAHILLIDAKNGKILKDLTPGAWDSPVFSLDGGQLYAFSPNGRELCYSSNHDPDPASSTNSDLWIVPIDSESSKPSPVNITAANHGWDGAPVYSPDGRYIAFRSQAVAGYESALFRLAVYDRQSKSVMILSDEKNFDNWITEAQWAPDSKSLIAQGEYQARNPLYRISLDRKIEPLLTDGTNGNVASWQQTPDGAAIIYERKKIDQPPELARYDVDSKQSRQLTTFNAKLLSAVDFRPAEEMWIQGDGNYKVHLFVIKPHDFDPSRKYPLILNVHGGPQSQWTDSYRGEWQIFPGKGYVTAFANPTGSTGYGQDFTAAISKDWGGRAFKDLMLVTDALEKLPYVDKDRMGSMGWSFGGYMMMWFEGNTTRFKASAAMMGVYDLTAMHGATEELWFPEWDLGGAPWDSALYRKWSPSEYVKNFKTPCLVITGEKDFRVPYTQSLEFFTDLQKRGVPSRLIVYENAGHWPNWHEMVFYYNAHLDWFHQWLGGGPAPYNPSEFIRNQLFK